MSSPHHAFSDPLLLPLLDLATHVTLFENLKHVSLIPLSPTPNKGQWAPVLIGFDLELYIIDSAVKDFLTRWRSKTKITHWGTQWSILFGLCSVYEILNLRRFHMTIECVRFWGDIEDLTICQPSHFTPLGWNWAEAANPFTIVSVCPSWCIYVPSWFWVWVFNAWFKRLMVKVEPGVVLPLWS